MTHSISNSHKVRNHYQQWPFPGKDFLSREGLLLLRYLNKWLITENPNERKPAKVIDVGCGTGHTTIALAKNFPGIQFLGIDITDKSLKVGRARAQKSNVKNITFQNVDIRKDFKISGQFQVALCLGVLHHVQDLDRTFKHVVQLVQKDGYLVIWLYGQYGRLKHTLNQSFLKLLTKNMSKSDAFMAAQTFLEELGHRFAIDTGFYTPKGSGRQGINWLLEHPQWLADQMIPAFEQSVTMQDILRLFSDHHLEFVKWFGVPCHLKSYTSLKILLECFEKLSTPDQLMAIDYLYKPEYYFIAGKKSSHN